MSRRLSFLAHAATSAQRRSRFPDDDPIEPLGAATVAAVTEGIGRVDAGWPAPGRAASETAAALGVATVPEARLESWRMGSWRGREIAEVAADELPAFGAWRQDPDAAPPGGGESLRSLLERIGWWLQDLDDAPRHTLVVADATVIRAVIVRVLGAVPAVFWLFDIAPLSFTLIQRSDGPWRVRSIGCGSRR